MVKIFTYFKHEQSVRKLERTIIFVGRTSIYSLQWLSTGIWNLYGAPDVPVNMEATYHRLNGEISMCHAWIEKFKLAQGVSQGVWVERPGKFEN